MKILVVEPNTRAPGHFEWFAVKTCLALSRLQNDVTLLTYGGVGPELFKGPCPFTIMDVAARGGHHVHEPGVCRSRKADTTSLRAFLSSELQQFRTFRLAASLLRQNGISVAHFSAADPILLSLTLPRCRRREGPVFLLTIHEVTKLGPGKHLAGRIYRRLYRHYLRKLISQKLDGAVVLDPSVKAALVSRLRLDSAGANRIRIFPHGIDEPADLADRNEARRRLGIDLNEKIFLVAGVLRKDKRVALAIEAVKGLTQCRLVIAGHAEGNEGEEIKELVRKHQCEQSVSIDASYIDDERLHAYFSATDALILPYSRSFHGASGIMTWALSHGRCIIASDAGHMGEIVRRERIGFAVEPEDPQRLRDAMLQFLSLKPELRAEMEQNARRVARRYSWDSVCQQWVKYYDELLERQS